jgi:ATP-binding cassette subfamily B protein
MNKKVKNLDNLKKLFKNFYFFSKLSFKSAPYAFSFFFILSIVDSIFPALTSKIFGDLIDSITGFIKNGDTTNVWFALIIYIIFQAIPGLTDVITSVCANINFLKFPNYLELYILKKRGSLDISQIEDPNFQDLTQRAFNNGTQPIIQIMDMGIGTIRKLLIILIGSGVILSIDWRIFLLVVILSIPKLIIEVKYGGLSWGINAENSREQRLYLTLRGFFVNKFSVIESKLFQIQNLFLEKINNIFNDFTSKRVTIEKERSGYRFLSEILSNIGMFGGLAIAINSSLNGVLSVGTVVFLFTIISSFSSNTTAFLLNLARLLERNLYASDIMEVLNTKNIIKEPAHTNKIRTDFAPEIEFKNVSFKYPKQSNFVINNLSFKIKGGEKIGLVGHNGAGKTTIVRLLLRVHDPVEGQILVNGIDLRTIKLADWWNMLGILPQDFSSFNFEVKNSISYGDVNKKFDLEKVKLAAKQSTAASFIEEWPENYDRMIGVEFGGAELSKGERQKMALARVFYRDSLVYILDEPTAAIDSKSTSEIFRNIEKISSKQSALIISHSFATLRRADRIMLLEHGNIIEEGTHEELMKNNGVYSTLYIQQKGEFE